VTKESIGIIRHNAGELCCDRLRSFCARGAREIRLKFQASIHLNASQSTPAWPTRVVPPNDAPNILLILTDDVGVGAPSIFGGVFRSSAPSKPRSLRELSMERVRKELEALRLRVEQGDLKEPEKIGAAATQILQRHHGHRYFAWELRKAQFHYSASGELPA
jgi:hypothetical protein